MRTGGGATFCLCRPRPVRPEERQGALAKRKRQRAADEGKLVARELRERVVGLAFTSDGLFNDCRRFEKIARQHGQPSEDDWAAALTSDGRPADETGPWPPCLWQLTQHLRRWWLVNQEIHKRLDDWPAELTDEAARPRLERWSVRLRRLVNDLSKPLSGTRSVGQVIPGSINTKLVNRQWAELSNELTKFQDDLLAIEGDSENAPGTTLVVFREEVADDTPENDEAHLVHLAQREIDRRSQSLFELYRDVFPWFLEELREIAGLPRSIILGPSATHEQNLAFNEACDRYRLGSTSGDARVVALRRRAKEEWEELTGLPSLGNSDNWEVAAAAAGIAAPDFLRLDFQVVFNAIRAWAIALAAQRRRAQVKPDVSRAGVLRQFIDTLDDIAGRVSLAELPSLPLMELRPMLNELERLAKRLDLDKPPIWLKEDESGARLLWRTCGGIITDQLVQTIQKPKEGTFQGVPIAHWMFGPSSVDEVGVTLTEWKRWAERLLEPEKPSEQPPAGSTIARTSEPVGKPKKRRGARKKWDDELSKRIWDAWKNGKGNYKKKAELERVFHIPLDEIRRRLNAYRSAIIRQNKRVKPRKSRAH